MLRDSTHLNLDQIRQFIDILGEIRQFLALRVLGNKYTSHQQTKSLVSLVQSLSYYSTVILTVLYCTDSVVIIFVNCQVDLYYLLVEVQSGAPPSS